MEADISRASGDGSSRLRLFRSARLERLTVVSAGGFAALWAVLLPAIGLTGALTAWTWTAVPLMIAGLIVWTFTEYALHRYVFHLQPSSPMLKQMVFVIHENHHAAPNDPLRNLMPPIVSVPVGALVWLLSLAVFGLSGTWFLLGFMVGYVAYDLVHFACHQFPMKGRIGRALKVHHMRHHHLKVGGNYAITGLIWDRVFGTLISSVPKG